MNRPQVTHSQYVLLLLSVPLITAVMHYPYFVYRVGTRGWLLTIIAGVICSLLLSYPVAALMNRFPDDTLVGISRRLFGRAVGSALPVPVFVFTGLMTTIFLLRGMAELYARTLLPRTPEMVVIAVGLFTAAYLASLGAEGLARFAEVAVYLIELPLIIPLFIVALRSVDLHYLEPLFWWPGRLPFSWDFVRSLTFFMALPTLLVFSPYLKPRGRSFRPIMWAAAGSFALLTIVTIIPLGVLGPETVTRLSFPVSVALNTINSTILFVQQLSYLTVALWSIFFFLCAGTMLWFCAHGCAEVVGFGSDRVWVWALAIALYVVSGYVLEFWTYVQTFSVWGAASGAVYIWIALVYWPAVWWRQRRRAKGNAGA